MSGVLRRGAVVWVDLDPVRGREQAGRRPAVVIAADAYLRSIPDLVPILPVATRDRGLPHHVRLVGQSLTLAQTSYAMTEQPRTVSKERVAAGAGEVDVATMSEIDRWLADFLALG